MSSADNWSTIAVDGSVDGHSTPSSTQDPNQKSKSDALKDIRITRFLAEESRMSSRSHDASVHIAAAKKRMMSEIRVFDVAFVSNVEAGNDAGNKDNSGK